MQIESHLLLFGARGDLLLSLQPLLVQFLLVALVFLLQGERSKVIYGDGGRR